MVLALALLMGSAAQAREIGDGRTLLQRGVTLHREAAYAASVATLEQARTRGDLSTVELALCGFYLASGYVAIGSLEAARREVRAVLGWQPGFELPPFTSPKVSTLFREVREESEKALRLKAMPPRRRGPHAVELWFEPSRAGVGAVYGAAWWRWRGEREYREAPLGHVGENLMTALEVQRGGTLEYFAEARGQTGAALAGTREQPLELPVAAPPVGRAADKPFWKQWWLWTTLGVVTAAGLGTGIYFGAR
jgi:hypothetical protein